MDIFLELGNIEESSSNESSDDFRNEDGILDNNNNTTLKKTEPTPLQKLLSESDSIHVPQKPHVCKYGTCCKVDRGVSKQKQLVRGAKSSWSFFVAKNRLEKEGLHDAQKRLSQLWQNLENKKEYEQLAERDKKRFEQDVKRLNTSEQAMLATYHHHRRQRKRVSQPLTAYNVFVRKRRPFIVANHPDFTFGEITSLLAQEWAKCDAEERSLFLKEANELNNIKS